MAAVAVGTVSADIGLLDKVPQIAGLYCGTAAITAGSFVYISQTDGNVYACETTANAPVAGVLARSANPGEPVTIFGKGTRLQYAAPGTFTPGQPLFLDVTTAGALNTAATTPDATGVARAVSDTDIVVVRDFTPAYG